MVKPETDRTVAETENENAAVWSGWDRCMWMHVLNSYISTIRRSMSFQQVFVLRIGMRRATRKQTD